MWFPTNHSIVAQRESEDCYRLLFEVLDQGLSNMQGMLLNNRCGDSPDLSNAVWRQSVKSKLSNLRLY